jgi:DNA-binding beta-propeller fold protein YncE
MNTTEERLLAAIRETAAEIAPGSTLPLSLPEPARRDLRPRLRGQRPSGWRPGGWRRTVAPVAAAASVIAVVAASLAITGTGGTRGQGPGAETSAARAAALASVPPYYVALTGNAAEAQHAVVRATATGAVLATITAPRPYTTLTWVSGAADDRTFVLAAQRWWRIAPGKAGLAAENRDGETRVRFFRLRLGPAGRVSRLTAIPSLPSGPRATQLAGIALSPDGAVLAVALHGSGSSDAGRDPEILGINLATGSQREWVWPGTGWVGNFKPMGEPMSWTADGRMLAFQKWTGNNVAVRLLDTTAPGASLRSARLVVRFSSRDGVFTISPVNTIITPDGTKLVVSLARNTLRPATTELRITEFSARTGQAARVLDPWRFKGSVSSWQDVLWTSSSGSTLIVESPSGTDPQGHWIRHAIEPVPGVLTGGQFTPLPRAPQNLLDVAW